MLCMYDKTAAARPTGLAVALAVNLSINMTLISAAVTNAKTRTGVVRSNYCGSSIHIKDTDISAKTICSANILACDECGRSHGQRTTIATYAIAAETTGVITGETVTSQSDFGVVQREIDGVDGHAVPVTAGDFQRRRSDPNAMIVVTVTLCVDTAGVSSVKAADHSICIVFKIQIAVVLQENAAAKGLIFCQLKFHMAQTQFAGVGDQIGRLSCTMFIGMSMRMDFQRKIFKRDITVRCIDTVLLQRQRVGIAAGNGQVLLTMELKARIPLNVLQQVDLITIRRRSDCIVQCGVVVRIVDLVDLAHSRGCGAVVVVRRVIVIRFLVRNFGGEIHCGPVIRCFIAVRIRKVIVTRSLVKSFGGGIPCGQVIRCCFIAARVRRAFLRARLRKVGNRRFLFLQIIKGVGNGGKVTPVQNGAVRIRDGGVGAQCKYTQRQNMKQQSDGKYYYEPSLFHNFFSSSF